MVTVSRSRIHLTSVLTGKHISRTIVVATYSSSSVTAATCYLVQTPLTQFTTAKKMIGQQLGSRSARTTASLQTSGSVMFT